MRLFVAADVPVGVKDAIEHGVVEPLRDAAAGARWTRPEGRHLTLAFLGRIDDDRVPDVSTALAGVRHGAFEAAFDAVGAFPNLRRPRVLWLGIGPGREELAGLAALVRAALEPVGFVPDVRPYHPHLTLARFGQPRQIGGLPAVEVPGDRFDVSEVVLFRSDLHPKGARYTALERFPLDA